ncbi:hypothetical protein TELCIR_08890 [Teladorsagia circumcincta]|uniref:Uncharacterized protein n=1 Tax=Teladorsagia circumcincta TaxID=45464 RepID=A0A2G9UGL2_TELCI|nr:hypothetical protein TELCIR_08890 [Teladorsagia circumcincta]
MQDITQNEYLSRLLAAHNRVDDLLRSRGLSAEDESKYLRAWEEIPIIRKERYQRVRTPSNSSDSGLSTDNDSDRSNSDAAKKEELVCDQHFSRPEASHSCLKTVVSLPSSLHTTLSCRESRPKPSKSLTAAFSFGRKPSFKPISKALPIGPIWNDPVDLICTSPAYVTLSTSHVLKCKEKSLAATLRIPIKRKVQVSAKFRAVPAKPQPDPQKQKNNTQGKQQLTQTDERRKVTEAKPATIVEQQRTVLASLKRKPSSAIPCTAEISIQHCSFYQVSQRAVERPEKNVRMNLRLTERAPNKCSTTIALPTTSRSLFAYLQVPQKPPSMNRTKSAQVMKQGRTVGKLNRSLTLDTQTEAKQQRKVNRLVIPEFFLDAEAAEDLKNARNRLRRVDSQTDGGLVVESEKSSPLKRSNAIRRKPPPAKPGLPISVGENCAPYKDFLISALPSSDSGKKQSVLPIDMPPPYFRRCNVVQVAEPLNPDGSLVRSATTSGAIATCTESIIAELSPIDRLLVEQFRRSKHIPRPKALAQRATFTFQAYQARGRLQTPTPTVEFIQYSTPNRQPPQPYRHSSPPSLRKVYRNVKQFSKRVHLLECPPLKKVDHAVRKKLKIRRPKRWIPRWRKKW